MLVVLLALVAGGALAVRHVAHEQPGWYLRTRYPLLYEGIVRGHARNYGLDPALLAAVIYAESKFRPDVRSGSGAIGLMQITPATARGIAVRTGGTAFRLGDLYDPEINVRYGSWYLRHLFEKYGDERDALAAYNAGQGNVDRWLRDGAEIPYPETRHYVERVLELRHAYARAYFSG